MRELSFLNKGITITFTDKRELDKDGNFVSEIFHSTEGLKEYIRYLDGNRANYCSCNFYGQRKGRNTSCSSDI
jgi:DNA gyrase/topoisomerase IV subunit B